MLHITINDDANIQPPKCFIRLLSICIRLLSDINVYKYLQTDIILIIILLKL